MYVHAYLIFCLVVCSLLSYVKLTTLCCGKTPATSQRPISLKLELPHSVSEVLPGHSCVRAYACLHMSPSVHRCIGVCTLMFCLFVLADESTLRYSCSGSHFQVRLLKLFSECLRRHFG